MQVRQLHILSINNSMNLKLDLAIGASKWNLPGEQGYPVQSFSAHSGLVYCMFGQLPG